MPLPRLARLSLLCLLACLCNVAGAQARVVAALPSFEVVSIKPDKSAGMASRIVMTPDGISLSNFPLHVLLVQTFDTTSDRLLGEPGWVNFCWFDLDAKVAAEDVSKLKNLRPADRWAMLLPILEDRFGLKFHHELRNLTGYALVVAKGGLKMKQTGPGETYPSDFLPADGAEGAGFIRLYPGDFSGLAVPAATLARQLSHILRATVVDKTGLSGRYDFDIKWSREEGAELAARLPNGGSPGTDASPPDPGPSIFSALEDQLGLKLEAKKTPTDVIVIDHIEQPSPN
jgi:uncharacterized protein (TIGR03435 family)